MLSSNCLYSCENFYNTSSVFSYYYLQICFSMTFYNCPVMSVCVCMCVCVHLYIHTHLLYILLYFIYNCAHAQDYLQYMNNYCINTYIHRYINSSYVLLHFYRLKHDENILLHKVKIV